VKHLAVHLAIRCAGSAGPGGCGVVIVDQSSARPVHESGHLIPGAGSAHRQALRGLITSLETAAALKPERLDVCCDNQELVEQITAGRFVESDAQSWLEQALRLLLSFDQWQIKADDQQLEPRCAELAQRVVQSGRAVDQLTADQAHRKQSESQTGVPQWTVELLEEPGRDCPAGCRAGRKYPFGPDVPEGLCVHAAEVALTDGPMHWDDPTQQRMTTCCPHCAVPMRIRRIDRDG
jgi:ribonuclease HI